MRRNVSRAGLGVVLCASLILSGCSAEWTGQADAIVTALIPATSNVVALVAALEGKNASAGDLQLVQNAAAQVGTDLQLIRSLIAAYEKADAPARPGVLEKIQNAIGSVQMNLHGLLQGLHIKDAATQTKVTAVIGIVLAEVEALAAVVPLFANQGPGARVQGAVAHDSRGVRGITVRAPLSADQFVSSYNSTLTARTGNAVMDRTSAGLRIHLHTSAVRWVSGGALK